MNDWWNDPPEEDYDDSEPTDYDYLLGRCDCDDDPQPEDFATPELPPDFFADRGLCPHGATYAECNACMIASDLAYDAARERGR